MPDEYISRKAALKDFEASNADNPRWTPQRVKTLLIRQPAAGHSIALLGAGADAYDLFGERGVHVVLDYRRDDLPRRGGFEPVGLRAAELARGRKAHHRVGRHSIHKGEAQITLHRRRQR